MILSIASYPAPNGFERKNMLNTLVSDFARAMKAVDTDGPIAIGATTKLAYQAGIGPHTETATLRLIKEKLISLDEDDEADG
jgi:hypothetical protein